MREGQCCVIVLGLGLVSIPARHSNVKSSNLVSLSPQAIQAAFPYGLLTLRYVSMEKKKYHADICKR